MHPNKSLARTLAATVLTTGVLMSGTTLAHEPKAPVNVKNIVLVHGAWADGSSWSKVIGPLERQGYHVTAVHLPLSSLADDTAAVRRALKLIAGPVLLVGHSYGGAVISVAGTADNVAGLVYVAAFAPKVGESTFDLSKTAVTPIATETEVDPEGYIRLTRKGIEESFAQDLPPAEKAVLYAAQSATSARSLASPVSEAAWYDKPSWYLLATHDRTIAPALQKQMSTTIGARTVEVAASHVPMLSHPQDVVALVARAASDLASAK